MCWPHYTRIESAPELLETFCNWCMSPAGECVYAYVCVCVDFVWVFGRRDYPLRRDARSYTYTSMHNQSLLYIIRRGVYTIDLLYIYRIAQRSFIWRAPGCLPLQLMVVEYTRGWCCPALSVINVRCHPLTGIHSFLYVYGSTAHHTTALVDRNVLIWSLTFGRGVCICFKPRAGRSHGNLFV